MSTPLQAAWRDATHEEMRRWPTLAMLKRNFTDARAIPDPDKGGPGVTYMKYQVTDAEPLTRVIFRKFLDHKDTDFGDGIIALFPDEPGTSDPGTCMSYMHVGQHGYATMRLVCGEPRTTRPASPEEYADLKRELESPPYEYRLKVIRRTPKDSDEIRRTRS